MDMVIIKTKILATIERFGYHVTPMQRHIPVDLRGSMEHPLSAAYRYPRRCLLIEAPIRWGFGLFHYPLDRPPLLEGISAEVFESQELGSEILRTRLSDFYRDWRPQSAASFLGLTDDEAPVLASHPPWASSWPWDPMDIAVRAELRREVVSRENYRAIGKKVSIDSGWKFCGPVSDQKLNIELKRLEGLFQEVKVNGFQRHNGVDGDIAITVLCTPNGEWRWHVLSGHHRFTVMSIMMKETITARVMQFVRRDEVKYWPGVVNGTFSMQSALKIFDRSFDCLPRSNSHIAVNKSLKTLE